MNSCFPPPTLSHTTTTPQTQSRSGSVSNASFTAEAASWASQLSRGSLALPDQALNGEPVVVYLDEKKLGEEKEELQKKFESFLKKQAEKAK